MLVGARNVGTLLVSVGYAPLALNDRNKNATPGMDTLNPPKFLVSVAGCVAARPQGVRNALRGG